MKKIVNIGTKLIVTLLALLNTLVMFGMRIIWTGISKVLGYEKNYSGFIYNLPMYLCILFFVVFLLSVWNLLGKKEKHPVTWVLLVLDIVFTIAIAAIIKGGAMDYLNFIWRDVFKTFGVVLLVTALVCLFKWYPGSKLSKNKAFIGAAIVVICAVALLFVLKLGINKLTYEPVVYAVEDEYQIVFSSSQNALGTVIIDGKEYYDTFAGSERSFTKVHKVSVPMKELDSAKAYTISIQRLHYRGPFGNINGKEQKYTYLFTPADTSDGINYFCLSDVHEHYDQAVKTASYDKDMDFLIICGDTVSCVPDPIDANGVNKLAFEITQGRKPVVYARGNHEVKGRAAELLHEYVGSENGKFYYSFVLGDIFGVVLDLGEDHDDDWWEYSGTAHFKDYIEEQIQWLDSLIKEKSYGEYKYHLAVCHIPPVFVNSRHNHTWAKKELTDRLNRMDIDMLITGHQHDIYVFEPGLIEPETTLTYNTKFKNGTYKGYLTDFNFPVLMSSKTGLTQTDGSDLFGAKSLIGLKINVEKDFKKQHCVYINSDGNALSVVNQFAEKEYGEEITITKKAIGSFEMN